MKPSEDYADIIRALRVMHGTVLEKTEKQFRDGVKETMPSKAADALEAVLAERDALKAENESMKQSLPLWAHKQMAANSEVIERLRAERDALAARLAPVDDEELVEKAAQIVAYHCGYVWGSSGWDRTAMLEGTRAAIAAIRPHIEAAERERCAKIAETPELWVTDKPTRGCDDIAAAIRSGSGK